MVWEFEQRITEGTGAKHRGVSMGDKIFNATFVALIPQNLVAKEPKDFRPISLIDSIYKIISKLLAEKLETVVNKLVDVIQGAWYLMQIGY